MAHHARVGRYGHRPARGRRPVYGLSGSTATPGRVSPPSSSREAPPPVEMCEMWPASLALLMAAIESPPPTMLIPRQVATACATTLVPLARASISKTPIGPFHTTV